jgi:hypothetical protein
MGDDELLERFEDTSLPFASFRHEEHVRVAYLYLRQHTLLDVLARFPKNLQKFAAAHGKAGLYHQTISWTYLFLIHERLAASVAGASATWTEFKQRNPDLLDRENSILAKYYAKQTLSSAEAREHFVMPDRLAPAECPVHAALVSDES